MLFLKECKKSICSLVFIIYVASVAGMYFSQFGGELKEPLKKPVPGQESYGYIEKEVPAVLMPAAIESLVLEYSQGSYGAYPFLFYKEVKLKESQQEKMAEIIRELTALNKEEVNEKNYKRFKELMKEADELIGGGSKYCDSYLVENFSLIPKTYEEALEEYEELIKEENIAEAYIRLFCDYAGIILSIIPIFVCVFLWQMDKRAQMEQLIYTRKISSIKLIGTRYAALTCCLTIPVILTFLHAFVKINALYPQINIQWGNAVGLAALWLVPSILVVTASGALVSEILNPIFAVLVQGVWWYTAIGMTDLTGDIQKWSFIIRHNNLSGLAVFQKQYGDFVFNRIFYMIFAFVLLAITVFLYHQKRRGRFHERKFIFKNLLHKYKK